MTLLPRTLLLLIAAFCSVLSLLIWFVLVRPVEVKTVRGVITYKTFKPAGEYVQYPQPTRGGFYSPNKIPIAEGYLFGIHVDAISADVGYVLNTVASQSYEVGQNVTIQYEVRGLPLVWKHIRVVNMQH